MARSRCRASLSLSTNRPTFFYAAESDGQKSSLSNKQHRSLVWGQCQASYTWCILRGDFHFLVLANDFSQRQAARYYWPSFFLICRFFICRWSRSVSGDLLLIPCKERWTGGDGRSRILTVVVLAISVSWSCSAMLLSIASWLEIDGGRCHHILHFCYHTSHHSL